jgi:hypothetical protein
MTTHRDTRTGTANTASTSA